MEAKTRALEIMKLEAELRSALYHFTKRTGIDIVACSVENTTTTFGEKRTVEYKVKLETGI